MGITSTFSRTNGLGGTPGYSWDYDVDTLGYKCYMIDLQAAIALEQMKKLPKHLEWRRHIQKCYNEGLSGLIRTPAWSETVQHYGARVPSMERNELINYLADKKIHTSVHYKPLHKHKIVNQNREYDVADKEWKKLISLPCHPGMTQEDIDYVIYWIKQYYHEKSITSYDGKTTIYHGTIVVED
jgi:perosamine synthetase